jgi:hypothetical protein
LALFVIVLIEVLFCHGTNATYPRIVGTLIESCVNRFVSFRAAQSCNSVRIQRSALPSRITGVWWRLLFLLGLANHFWAAQYSSHDILVGLDKNEIGTCNGASKLRITASVRGSESIMWNVTCSMSCCSGILVQAVRAV